MGLEGDYGTIHIELGPDITEADADWLTDRIAGLLFTKRRLRNKDTIMSIHTDGPCETSPHCFGAFLRKREANAV